MRPAPSLIKRIDNGDDMKQSAALILALGATAAQAQTNVTIYGIVDAALVGERGGSARTAASSRRRRRMGATCCSACPHPSVRAR